MSGAFGLAAMRFGNGSVTDGEPVFHAPWQAEAFALAVELNRRGLFTWSEWADTLGRTIASAEETQDDHHAHADHHADDDAADGARYYQQWLAALEVLLVKKGITSTAEIEDVTTAWVAAAEATPHGQPVVLKR